jgi:(+)-neomenthol dehydrogenase
VILTARDEKRGSEAVEKLHESGLPDVQFHRLDVSDPSGAARLAEFIREKFGRLDILINNAGVIGASALIDTTTPIQEMLVGKSAMERLQWLLQRSTESYEEAEECLIINYFGTRYVTGALLPILLSSSDGRLINVSSNYGLLRVPLLSELAQLSEFSGLLSVLIRRIFVPCSGSVFQRRKS